ncbi:MAG: hypothetical protein GY754_21080, partial [bacterium]|nr:hypothetical protein [bacterium]
MFSRIVLLIKVLVLMLVMTSGVYASNFADTYGFSATGISMGNAMTAIVNDWSSVYYNMAGLGKTGHLRSGGFGETDSGSGDMTLKMRRTADPVQKPKSTDKPHLSEVSLSFLYTIPQFNIDINRSGVGGDSGLNFGAMVIGLAVDMNIICELPSFISSGRIGLGLSANADGSLVKVNDIDPRTHNYVRYGREAQKAVILAGFGLGFLDDM